MTNIFILGVSRAGKSTLTKKNKTRIFILQNDSIRSYHKCL